MGFLSLSLFLPSKKKKSCKTVELFLELFKSSPNTHLSLYYDGFGSFSLSTSSSSQFLFISDLLKMGYLSCNSKSAIVICDPHNYWDLKTKKKKSSSKTHKPKIKRFSYTDLESSTQNFSPQFFLGKGSHGSVYKAVLEQGKLIVAVKRTPPSSSSTSFIQEEKEISNNVMMNTTTSTTPVDNEIEILSKIRNPRLVNLLGFSIDSYDNKLLVVEYMPNGSLYDLLHSNALPIPGWKKRIRYALQVSKAIETLHNSNPPIIHRDIKSSNVLIDGNWNARLGDFGLALRGYVEDVRIKCTPPAGTLGYLDPGYIAPENLSAKSDVFSFGILLLEIISGRNAIDVNYSPPSVIDWALPLIKQGEFVSLYDTRIQVPENLSVLEQLSVLASHCVRTNVEKRPTMSEVVNCLRIVQHRVSSPIWNNFRRRMSKENSLPSPSSSSQELIDNNEETVNSTNRNSKLNYKKVSSFEHCIDFSEEHSGDRFSRSNSIGTITEIKMESLPLVEMKHGLGVKRANNVIRLNKSRSLGGLHSTKLLLDNGERGFVFQLVKNPQIRVFDFSKLVISMDNCSEEKKKKKMSVERKKCKLLSVSSTEM